MSHQVRAGSCSNCRFHMGRRWRLALRSLAQSPRGFQGFRRSLNRRYRQRHHPPHCRCQRRPRPRRQRPFRTRANRCLRSQTARPATPPPQQPSTRSRSMSSSACRSPTAWVGSISRCRRYGLGQRGVSRPQPSSVKRRTAPQKPTPLRRSDWHPDGAGRCEQSCVVTGQLHRLPARPQELERCQVQGIDGSHGNREWVQGARENGRA